MNTGTDVSQIDLSDLAEVRFSRPIEFRIACAVQAYEAILEHVQAFLNVEVCGVLVGKVYKDLDGPYIEITDSIRGEEASERAAQVTFTHETWAHISERMDIEYSDKKIVGWYHSHPGFGIFLSQPDEFIHSSFFSQPWQIALVVDPRSHEEGFFIWRNGKALPIEQYWIGDKLKRYRPRSEKTEESADGHLETQLHPSSQKPSIFSGVFLLLGVLAFLGSFVMRSGTDSRDQGMRAANSRPDDSALRGESDATRELLARGIVAAGPISISRVGDGIRISGSVFTYRQKDEITAAIGKDRDSLFVDNRNVTVTNQYRVRTGDTLSGIAHRVYGTDREWVVIFQANRAGLQNPDSIPANMTLRLPEVVAHQ